MDARIDPIALLGLALGDAHVIRNAGGIVDDGAVRSLVISQRKLDTREVLVLQHTGCGVLGLDDEAFAREIEADAGARPRWAGGGFADLDESVRRSVEALRGERALPRRDAIRGAVVDIATGAVREVAAPA
jgi:carbonic anhydrase